MLITFDNLITLLLYFYPEDEYFHSSIFTCGDPTMEKDVGSVTKDESCAITISMLGLEVSQGHADHVFLYVKGHAGTCGDMRGHAGTCGPCLSLRKGTCGDMQGHADHAFPYVKVMLMESRRSELILEFQVKSGGISMITYTVSTR